MQRYVVEHGNQAYHVIDVSGFESLGLTGFGPNFNVLATRNSVEVNYLGRIVTQYRADIEQATMDEMVPLGRFDIYETEPLQQAQSDKLSNFVRRVLG